MKNKITFFVLLFANATFLISCNNSENPTSGYNDVNSTIAITNGTLIDGTGSDPIPDALIIIKDTNIMSAGNASGLDIPAGATIIDVDGSYILPGFINSHVHGAFNENNLKEWAKSGVTTVRDVGTTQSPEEAFLKKKINMLIDAGADFIKIAIEDDLQGRNQACRSPTFLV